MTLRTSSTTELPLAITKILASVQSDLLLGGTGPDFFTKKEPAFFRARERLPFNVSASVCVP